MALLTCYKQLRDTNRKLFAEREQLRQALVVRADARGHFKFSMAKLLNTCQILWQDPVAACSEILSAHLGIENKRVSEAVCLSSIVKCSLISVVKVVAVPFFGIEFPGSWFRAI